MPYGLTIIVASAEFFKFEFPVIDTSVYGYPEFVFVLMAKDVDNGKTALILRIG